MTDRFRGDFDHLQRAVITCGIDGSWRDEGDGSKRFSASNDGILRWWATTGTLLFQGPDPGKSELRDAVLTALSDDENSRGLIRKSHTEKKIFIVHGHDIPALERLELVLRRLDLDPYMLIKDAGSGGTLIEERKDRKGWNRCLWNCHYDAGRYWLFCQRRSGQSKEPGASECNSRNGDDACVADEKKCSHPPACFYRAALRCRRDKIYLIRQRYIRMHSSISWAAHEFRF